MRIDKYLKVSRIVKRRTVAKSLADNSRLFLNGRVAKAGSEVEVGDEIDIIFGQRKLSIRVKMVEENVRKEQCSEMYELIADTYIENE